MAGGLQRQGAPHGKEPSALNLTADTVMGAYQYESSVCAYCRKQTKGMRSILVIPVPPRGIVKYTCNPSCTPRQAHIERMAAYEKKRTGKSRQ